MPCSASAPTPCGGTRRRLPTPATHSVRAFAPSTAWGARTQSNMTLRMIPGTDDSHSSSAVDASVTLDLPLERPRGAAIPPKGRGRASALLRERFAHDLRRRTHVTQGICRKKLTQRTFCGKETIQDFVAGRPALPFLLGTPKRSSSLAEGSRALMPPWRGVVTGTFVEKGLRPSKVGIVGGRIDKDERCKMPQLDCRRP
jgi:hypothetical protein